MSWQPPSISFVNRTSLRDTDGIRTNEEFMNKMVYFPPKLLKELHHGFAS